MKAYTNYYVWLCETDNSPAQSDEVYSIQNNEYIRVENHTKNLTVDIAKKLLIAVEYEAQEYINISKYDIDDSIVSINVKPICIFESRNNFNLNEYFLKFKKVNSNEIETLPLSSLIFDKYKSTTFPINRTVVNSMYNLGWHRTVESWVKNENSGVIIEEFTSMSQQLIRFRNALRLKENHNNRLLRNRIPKSANILKNEIEVPKHSIFAESRISTNNRDITEPLRHAGIPGPDIERPIRPYQTINRETVQPIGIGDIYYPLREYNSVDSEIEHPISFVQNPSIAPVNNSFDDSF